jgi:anti-anti-sigma factor
MEGRGPPRGEALARTGVRCGLTRERRGVMEMRARVFEVEREGDTAVITPQADLRELAWREIEAAGEELLALGADAVGNMVVDLGKTDYCGSTALGVLVRLGRQACGRNGRMALCNVSPHGWEVLAVTGLAGLWPAYPSRAEAVEGVRGWGDRGRSRV